MALFAALLLVLQALVFLGPASAEPETCNQVGDGQYTDLKESSSGEWGEITATKVGDEITLELDLNDGYEIHICLKKGNENSGMGTREVVYVGPQTDLPISYDSENDIISHYGFYVVDVCPTGTDNAGMPVDQVDACDDAPIQVAPEEPDFRDPSCEDPTVGYTLPETTGVTYTIDDDSPEPGDTVTVTATADEGYTLTGDTTEWPYTYDDAPTNCGGGGELPDENVTALAPTATQPDCDTDATLTIPSNVRGVSYEVLGEVAPGQSVTVRASERPGFDLEGEREWTFDFDEAPSAEECDDETGVSPDVVMRPVVSFTDPSCENPEGADVTTTETDGVDYTIDGLVAPGGTVTVTAVALDGYTIPAALDSEWTFAFAELDCEEEPPAEEPQEPQVQPVEVLPNVVEKPAPQAAPDVAAAAQELPATGFETSELLMLALLLMGLGGMVLLAPERRRREW